MFVCFQGLDTMVLIGMIYILIQWAKTCPTQIPATFSLTPETKRPNTGAASTQPRSTISEGGKGWFANI